MTPPPDTELFQLPNYVSCAFQHYVQNRDRLITEYRYHWVTISMTDGHFVESFFPDDTASLKALLGHIGNGPEYNGSLTIYIGDELKPKFDQILIHFWMHHTAMQTLFGKPTKMEASEDR